MRHGFVSMDHGGESACRKVVVEEKTDFMEGDIEPSVELTPRMQQIPGACARWEVAMNQGASRNMLYAHA